MKPIISAVVPIYMVEGYLDKCIYSLINQTYMNIEVILVDDGSPDSCPGICDSYEKEDSRIKVIHKINGGVSDARNVGLKQATGEYVLFVDPDDWIEINTCELFLEAIGCNKPDIVVGNAKRIEKRKVLNMQHEFNTEGQMVTGKQFLKNELRSGTMYMTIWLNLYNRNFLLNNKFKFEVGLLHEDEEFIPRVFLKADTVIGTDIIFYNYLRRENSITTAKNKVKNAEHIMKICKELEEIYKTIEDNDLRKLLNDNLVDKFLSIFQEAGLHKKEYSYLVHTKFLLNKPFTRKNKLRVLLFRLNKTLYYYTNKLSKISGNWNK